MKIKIRKVVETLTEVELHPDIKWAVVGTNSNLVYGIYLYKHEAEKFMKDSLFRLEICEIVK